jgi:DNA-binding SARP family transcriptional activator
MSQIEPPASWSASLPFALSGLDDFGLSPPESLPANDLEAMIRALAELRPALGRAAADARLAQARVEQIRESEAALLERLLEGLSRGSERLASFPLVASLPFALGVVDLPRPAEIDAAPTLRVRLLGRFEAAIAGRPVTGWRGKRARQLFAYLLLYRHEELSRHRLMGVFWPDHPEERAENNLSLAVLTLRRVLDADHEGPSLVGHRDGRYAIVAEDIWLDTEAFLDLVRRSAALESRDALTAAGFLDEAIEIYRGELLPSDLYEEWTQRARGQLQDAFIDALRRRARLARGSDDIDLSIRLNQRLLEQDPSLEDAHRQLILDYLATGQRARAFHQIEVCTRALRRHLGVSPSAETLAIFARVRNST